MMALLVFVVPLIGQTPADRAMLSAWDDSLQRATSVDAVSRYVELAKSGEGSARSLRRTLYQIRLAEVKNDRTGLELGLDNLAWDIGGHGDWPWPYVLQARTFFAMHTREAPLLPSSGSLLGESYLDAGWRALRRALELDAAMPEATHLLGAILIPSGDRELHPDQVRALGAMVAQSHPDADILLVWGRHLRTLRRYDSAQKIFTLAAFRGGDYSRLALERARTFLAQGDSINATTAYWDGIDHLTPIGRELYRFDLSWILSDDSLAVFDKVPAKGVEKWLHAFWNGRDALAANDVGQRLLEHLRRWVVVHSDYRLLSPWRKTMYDRVELGYDQGWECLGSEKKLYELLGTQPSHEGDLRHRELLLDHRGVVYLRHGEPIVKIGGLPIKRDELAEPPSTRAEANQESVDESNGANNESWVYWIDGEWRMIHFMGSRALGTYAATTLKGILPFNEEAYATRGQYLTVYANAAVEIRRYWDQVRAKQVPLALGCWQYTRAAALQSRKDAKVATATDSDSPPLGFPWGSVIRSYALGVAGGTSSKALVTYAFRARDLQANQISLAQFDYPFALKLVAYQSTADLRVDVDTIIHAYASRKLPASGWVTGSLELPLGAGVWQLAIKANQGDPQHGAYAVRKGLQINAPETLALSDIVTGREGGLPWRAPDGKDFLLNPIGVWPAKASVPLYYEVSGLAAGASYKTRVLMYRSDDKKASLTLESNETATGPRTMVRKVLGLEKLSSGSYRLVIVIEANGNRVERSTALIINK